MESFRTISRDRYISQKFNEETITKQNTNLQKEYDRLNQRFFNNQLPKIPLKWSMSKRFGGKVVSRGIKDDVSTWVIKHLEISLFSELDKKEFLGLLAHEMIHVYLITIQKTNDYGDQHGLFFKQEMDRINKMRPGFVVPISEDITTKKVSKDVKMKKVGVVLFEISTKRVEPEIQIYQARVMDEIVKIYKEFPESWWKNQKIFFMYSDNLELQKYPVTRGYNLIKLINRGKKFTTYPISGEFARELKDTGKIIEVVSR